MRETPCGPPHPPPLVAPPPRLRRFPPSPRAGWGEANPGGGQDEIARYLEKSRKEVVQSASLLKTIMDILGVPEIKS